jgi:hypothetical protein
LNLNSTFPPKDEPTFLKTVQRTVLVGEMSLQQQVLQAVPENGVVLAPFETVARSRTENVTEEFCVVCLRNYSVNGILIPTLSF